MKRDCWFDDPELRRMRLPIACWQWLRAEGHVLVLLWGRPWDYRSFGWHIQISRRASGDPFGEGA